jgi:hypothetical protein
VCNLLERMLLLLLCRCLYMGCWYEIVNDGAERLTGGCTSDQSDAGEEGGRHDYTFK